MWQINREMGCTIDDLVRWMPMAMGDLYPYTSLKIDDKLLISSQVPLVQVVGISRPSRRIALLSIPVLDLNLRFAKSLIAFQCEEAIKRFDLYTRRGGG